MNDIELSALAALVTAETGAMRLFDEERLKHGCSVGYGDNVLRLDSVVCLEAELRRRSVLVDQSVRDEEKNHG